MSQNVLDNYAKTNPRRDAAVVGLRNNHGHILLTRTAQLPHWWQPIGGGIDPEDESPLAAVLRETKEELDIDLDPKSVLAVMTAPYDFGVGTIYFFEATIDEQSRGFQVHQDEILDIQWFTVEDSLKLPTMPATSSFLQHLAK